MLDEVKNEVVNRASEMTNRTKLSTPQELFAHKLGACLTMENTVKGMLEKLIGEAKDSELKQQLRHHKEETEAQIRNLHQAFSSIGQDAEEKPCPAIKGIEAEGDATLKMVENDSLTDDVILAGCAETEHHEIAVYETLIVHADALGHDDIVALLRENLEQEQHTLGEVLKASLKHAQQHTGATA
jgi:ferritin-like metal-binding protein YciE